MKVLLNTTTLNTGGALQASINFIRLSESNVSGIEWHYALSEQVAEQVDTQSMSGRHKVFSASPAKNKSAKKDLLKYESFLQPDIVFTFFGPAYTQFRSKHLCGIANAWVTHPNKHAYSSLSFKNRLLSKLGKQYRRYWYKQANAWVVEADVAKKNLINKYNFPKDKIDVVPNTCSDIFLRDSQDINKSLSDKVFKIFVFSSYYPHKNLEIIPAVAAYIASKKAKQDFRFVLTLSENHSAYLDILSEARKLSVEKYITTIGFVPIKAAPRAYQNCDVCFLPTLLETSTAVFPEAMAMQRPIVTTDFEFNRNICGDAAAYFEPRNPQEAGKLLLNLMASEEKFDSLVKKGQERLKEIPTLQQKYQLYIDCLQKLYND